MVNHRSPKAELRVRFSPALPSKMNKVSSFLKEVQIELKKVTWPTRQQATRLTALVVGISLVVGLYVGMLDYVLTKVVEVIVR